jgi:hypothetical protein
MKLVTYDSPDGARAGILVDETVVDAEDCARAASLDGAVTWDSVKSIVAGTAQAELDALAAAAGRTRCSTR